MQRRTKQVVIGVLFLASLTYFLTAYYTPYWQDPRITDEVSGTVLGVTGCLLPAVLALFLFLKPDAAGPTSTKQAIALFPLPWFIGSWMLGSSMLRYCDGFGCGGVIIVAPIIVGIITLLCFAFWHLFKQYAYQSLFVTEPSITKTAIVIVFSASLLLFGTIMFVDASSCGTKLDAFVREFEGNCFAAKALEQGNPAICKQSVYQTDQCYAILAYQVDSPQQCAKLSGQLRDNCYLRLYPVGDIRTGNEEGLQYVSSEKRDLLIGNAASDTGNWQLCDQITAIVVRESCYLQAARKTGDISYCEKIQETAQWDLKDNCLQSSS